VADDDAANLTRSRITLPEISSRAWEHPADRGALAALRKLKGFDFLLRKLGALWDERALRLTYVASAIRVDDRQFPAMHRLFAEAAATLDVRELPELYVDSYPFPMAWALGIDRPFVVVTSSMVESFDDEELRYVLGHELGHVLSGHVLYTTMLHQLLRASNAVSWLPFGTLGVRAVLAALHEWYRKAELSCDRAGLLGGQDPAAALRVHMKLAGGGRLQDLDATAFRAQGEEYLANTDLRDSVLKLLLLEATTHPFAVVRAAELQHWVDEGAYTRILGGEYVRRGDDDSASVREDVQDATRHYSNAFEQSQDALVGLVRDVGGGLAGVRDWGTSKLARDDEGDEGQTG